MIENVPPHLIRRDLLICLLLVLLPFSVYWPVCGYGFINFDDTAYVVYNRHVNTGLTRENIIWAFNFSEDGYYWHPLTWLSHALDCEIYGLSPGRHHLTSLLFHIGNTLLLFFGFRRMTGKFWQSSFVAALFAVHPMNVESVAWIAERKNVLSTFCWLLTLLTYTKYVERPALDRYLLLCLTFLLGLLTKPMLVTLPFTLLLLDYWPLGRFGNLTGNIENGVHYLQIMRSGGRLIIEKIPLFLLSGLSISLSLASLPDHNRFAVGDKRSLLLRLENAVVSYVEYLWKLIWPRKLSAYYPYPDAVPVWQTLGAICLLTLISWVALRSLKKKPWIGAGWFWYLGTLVPVSGLVQAGFWPALADRWVYVPFIGIFFLFTWTVADSLSQFRYRQILLSMGAAAVILSLMGVTVLQVRNWRDSLTFYTHVVNVTPPNAFGYNGLGFELAKRGKQTEALTLLRKAIVLDPDYAIAYANLGTLLLEQGKLEEAILHFNRVLELDPKSDKSHNNIGVALVRQGKMKEAIPHFREALRIQPDDSGARHNLALALKQLEQDQAAAKNNE